MITYAIINGIFHISPSENIGYSELVGFLKDVSKIKELPKELKVFFDLRNINVQLHLDEIEKLSEMAEAVTSELYSVKTAFIVEDPTVTAYTMIYSWLPKTNRIQREQFSTETAALEWLNSEDKN